MEELLITIAVAAASAFWIGLIKPAWVGMANRKKSSAVYLTVCFLAAGVGAELYPTTQTQTVTTQEPTGLLEYKRDNPLTCTDGLQQLSKPSDLHWVFGDYTEEDQKLKIISLNPLKVHVFAEVYDTQRHQDVIEHLVKMALVTTLYNVFSFSDKNELTITASAKSIHSLDHRTGHTEFTHLKSPIYTITKTRQQALSDLKKHTDATSFADLFEKDVVCSYSSIRGQILYDDQGGIGITKFFNEIKK